MFLLHEYDIFWTFLIIASLIPILAFSISGLLAPVSEGGFEAYRRLEG